MYTYKLILMSVLNTFTVQISIGYLIFTKGENIKFLSNPENHYYIIKSTLT